MNEALTVKTDEAVAIVGLLIKRWQLRIFGWHFATIYRHEMCLGDERTSVEWWLYLFGSLGFAIHYPQDNQ
jgi:hypothetical protein